MLLNTAKGNLGKKCSPSPESSQPQAMMMERIKGVGDQNFSSPMQSCRDQACPRDMTSILYL